MKKLYETLICGLTFYICSGNEEYLIMAENPKQKDSQFGDVGKLIQDKSIFMTQTLEQAKAFIATIDDKWAREIKRSFKKKEEV